MIRIVLATVVTAALSAPARAGAPEHRNPAAVVNPGHTPYCMTRLLSALKVCPGSRNRVLGVAQMIRKSAYLPCDGAEMADAVNSLFALKKIREVITAHGYYWGLSREARIEMIADSAVDDEASDLCVALDEARGKGSI